MTGSTAHPVTDALPPDELVRTRDELVLVLQRLHLLVDHRSPVPCSFQHEYADPYPAALANLRLTLARLQQEERSIAPAPRSAHL